jgi:hypothetical protein
MRDGVTAGKRGIEPSFNPGAHFGSELGRLEPNTRLEREGPGPHRERIELRSPNFKHLEIEAELGSEQPERAAIARAGACRSRGELSRFDDGRLPAQVLFVVDQILIDLCDGSTGVDAEA